MSDPEFSALIAEVILELPKEHLQAVHNVAVVYADYPTDAQRQQLHLRNDETLFGLYEGVPLSQRQGKSTLLPDKITLFKQPALEHAATYEQLRANVKHTVWHELAHYFGLDHQAIEKLERNVK